MINLHTKLKIRWLGPKNLMLLRVVYTWWSHPVKARKCIIGTLAKLVKQSRLMDWCKEPPCHLKEDIEVNSSLETLLRLFIKALIY